MSDVIKMSFPADPKYISAIRLGICAACGKFDFDIDKLEDIKTCVSESCLLFMCNQKCKCFEITAVLGDSLSVSVEGGETEEKQECSECREFNAEMSKMMIEALADKIEISEKDGIISKVSFYIGLGE